MRERLLDAAMQRFGRRGMDGVSVAEIAQTVGTSKANVLHHFGSKDGLYAAALDFVGEELDRRTARASSNADPAAALDEELSDWAATRPEQVRLLAYGLLRLTERPGRWRLAKTVDAMLALQPGDDPDERVDRLTRLLGRLTYGVMIQPLVGELGRIVPAAGARASYDLSSGAA